MFNVNERVKRYKETKKIAMSLRGEVERLENLKKGLEEAINDENKKCQKLSEEVIASIKVGDLLDKISSLLDVDRKDITVKIIVLGGTYAKSLKELCGYKRENAGDLNSYLSIKYKDGTNICTKNLRMFNDLSEVQADGYILLRHCFLERGNFQRSNLVVNKNINDIICNFRVDAFDMAMYEECEMVLPLALRECIKDNNQVFIIDRQKQLIRR